jgi:hypothetical protein
MDYDGYGRELPGVWVLDEKWLLTYYTSVEMPSGTL